MELRQESLFADETKGGIEVIYSKFIDQRRMDYKALFGGFDHLRVITFSYGLGFVETVADMFEDVEIIIGSMNTVRPDIVDVAMHQKLEMKRLSKRKQLVERVKDGSVRIYFNMRKMSHEKLYILSADDGRCRIITGSANLSKRAFTGGQYEEITCFDGDVVMFDNRLARFESLKGMSSTTPLEPAAMVDFASVAGDSEGELEVVPVMRAKGVVYLCDMPEDDDEVDPRFTATGLPRRPPSRRSAKRRSGSSRAWMPWRTRPPASPARRTACPSAGTTKSRASSRTPARPCAACPVPVRAS